MTFTKLFSSITESTVWCEPDRTRLVWITMLAMADRYGRVWGSIPGLANRARVPVEDARLAITTFLSPDPDSRSPEQEGRRITEIDGGWQLINHQKYRVLRDEEERRRQNREAKARQRKKVSQSQPKVSQSQPTGQPIADAETDADADALKKNKTTPLPPKGIDLPAWIPFEQWNAYIEMRKGIKKPLSLHALKLAIHTLEELRQAGHDVVAVLNQSIFNNWKGLFAVRGAPHGKQPTQQHFRDHQATPGKYAGLGTVFDPDGDE